MFKLIIIESAMMALLKFLNNPKNKKIKAFLLKEETQSTLAEIYGLYADFVEQHEEQD